VTDRRIEPKDWLRVVEYASPQAIQAYLDTARKDRRRLDLHIGRLEALLATRTTEIEAGTWPPKEQQ
jgi:hypothetical protein